MGPNQRSKVSRKKRKQSTRLQTARVAGTSKRTAPAIVKAEAARKGLSDLPGEVRNLIYEYALSGGTIRLNGGGNVGNDIALGFFMTCKAVKRETTGLFYSGNDFRIDLLGFIKEASMANWKISEFLLWRNQISKPRLSRNLDMMGGKRLSMIRTFVFAFHVRTARVTPYINPRDIPQLRVVPELADVAIELKLTSKPPYYKLKIRADESAETRSNVLDEVIADLSHFVRHTIINRGLRALSKVDVLDLTSQVITCGLCVRPGGSAAGWRRPE